MPELSIIVTSLNEGKWLRPCLDSVFSHTGGVDLDVVVVDIESSDDTAAIVDSYPVARRISCVNGGFGYANNRGMLATESAYLLLLNPDTEILQGTFADVLEEFAARPRLGITGVRQMTGAGELYPTMRRFTSLTTGVAEALGSERAGFSRNLGERVLDLDRYGSFSCCDWTIGSFMLMRREALLSAGLFDERFFLYSEEQDLCLRVRQAGWKVAHSPRMMIVHHVGKAGPNPRLEAQRCFARAQYARKHLSPVRRIGYLTSLIAGETLRACMPAREDRLRDRRTAARRSLRTLLGATEPPFGPPPPTALPEAQPDHSGHWGSRT